MTVSKKTLVTCMLIACLGFASNVTAQSPDSLPRTMRPVIRGRQAAVSSMKAEGTEVASRILQKGGNAFDAVVGGQAALAVTDFALNGVGGDAVVLVYDASPVLRGLGASNGARLLELNLVMSERPVTRPGSMRSGATWRLLAQLGLV